MMKKQAYLKTIGILYLSVVLLAMSVALFIHSVFRFNFGLAALIIFVLAIPFSFIGFKLLMAREKNKPYVKLHKECREELYKNGYSEKFFELSEKAINAHKNGEKINSVYLKDFVLFSVDYYNATEQYDKALSYIMLLNENSFTARDTRFIDYGMSALMYYGCLIETFRGLKDKENAIKVIERAKPLLDGEFKAEVLEMSAYTIYYNYYMLIENYERAQEYLGKLLAFNSPEADRYFPKYYLEAEYDLYLGKREDAVSALRKMEPLLEGESKTLLCFFYSRYAERLGLKEIATQDK